jgi:DNA-binding CsgD family transcriptional regulator
MAAEPAPRLLTAPDRRILWTSAAAARLLKRGTELTQRDGVLVAADAARSTALENFLNALTDDDGILSLKSMIPGRHAVVRARRVSHEGEEGLGLCVHVAEPDSVPVYAGYSSAFALTSAEKRVVDSMIGGSTVDQIAGLARATKETVRSHVKSVYAKMGVSSREELFRKLAPFRVL